MRPPLNTRIAQTAAAKADGDYLMGWVDGQPPGSTAEAVVNVSWWAAEAFCQDRGGLLSVESAPLDWTEGPAQPLLEWRAAGRAPAWRRFDGAQSTTGRWHESNPFTGFRCAR